jgi:DHA1 family tetracycline resistance protein-like MFS transporter
MMLFGTGLLSIIVQTLVVGRVVRLVGERGALLIGLASAIFGFAIYALAPTPRGFFTGIAAGALSNLILPGLQSLMSRRVSGNQQGRLQGVNSAFMGVCSIIGPMIYLPALAFAVRQDAVLHLPGLPVLIAASFCTAALVLSVFLAKPVEDA